MSLRSAHYNDSLESEEALAPNVDAMYFFFDDIFLYQMYTPIHTHTQTHTHTIYLSFYLSVCLSVCLSVYACVYTPYYTHALCNICI